MIENPNISVVMSIYNSQRYLEESIASILDQTYGDFEFIIINDGSTDRSRQIIEQFNDPRIKLIDNLVNIGLTKSLNLGISKAVGKFVARQDGDDISLKERFEQQVEFMLHNPDVAVVGCSSILIDEVGNFIKVNPFPQFFDYNTQPNLRSMICHGSAFIQKSCLAQVGYYRNYFRTSQDHDLWRRLGERYQLANLHGSFYKLRVHSESITKTKRCEQRAYSQILQHFSQERREKGRDSLGLVFRGKWSESDCRGYNRIKGLSHKCFIPAFCNHRKHNWLFLLLWLLVSLILYPRNSLSINYIKNLYQKAINKLSHRKGNSYE